MVADVNSSSCIDRALFVGAGDEGDEGFMVDGMGRSVSCDVQQQQSLRVIFQYRVIGMFHGDGVHGCHRTISWLIIY